VRRYAQEAGLEVADKAASACLGDPRHSRCTGPSRSRRRRFAGCGIPGGACAAPWDTRTGGVGCQ
jgi:hypothetical protein